MKDITIRTLEKQIFTIKGSKIERNPNGVYVSDENGKVIGTFPSEASVYFNE